MPAPTWLKAFACSNSSASMPRWRSASASVMPPIPPPAIRTLRPPWGMTSLDFLDFHLDDYRRKLGQPYIFQKGKDVTMSMMKSRRFMLGAGLVLAVLFGVGPASAQDYPSRPITVIIPFAGGSASDVVSRI